jgi:ubiquinone/menaquinone biosynthesis C-methylase UbiE
MASASKGEIRGFWDKNPVCSNFIKERPGTIGFYRTFDAHVSKIEKPVEHIYDFGGYRGRKVLDIGCGNGYVLSRYASKGADVTGIDLTLKAIELSKKRFKLFKLKGSFRTADAEKLPFADSTFDLVTSMGVLHHTPDTEKAINEAHRVTKPGGRTLLMLYHKNSFLYYVYYPVLRLARREHWGKSLDQMVCVYDGTKNPLGKAFTRADVRRMCRRYKSVKITTHYLSKDQIPLPLGIAKWLVPQKLLDSLSSSIGWFIYIDCRK